MAESPTRHWTVADLEALPDDGWTRYEIIGGVLFEMRAASNVHNESGSETIIELGNWNRGTGLGTVLMVPDLLFTEDTKVIPDIVWVSPRRRAALEQADRKLHGGPGLIVEILSPGAENAHRDRETKRALYARWRVDEYWILDPGRRTVSVYRHNGEDLLLVATLGPEDVLTSPVLAGFAAPAARLFSATPHA